MKKLSLLTLLLLAVGVSAVRAKDVRYNFAQDEDFSKYKIYKWVNIKNADQVDELTAKQITNALDAELAKKGLTKTDGDSADLYIWIPDRDRNGEADELLQLGVGLWPRMGRRRDLNVDNGRDNLDDLYGATGSGYVRCHEKRAGLAWCSIENHRSQSEA
jgi:protein involved in temperature-dependent protein secretion